MGEGKAEVLSQEQLRELAGAALAARKNAYTPYSDYSVGAALLTAEKKIYGAAI